MIGQALLEAIGGSTKFSVSKLDASRYFCNWNRHILNSFFIILYTHISNNVCIIYINFRQSQNVGDLLQAGNGIFQDINKYLQEWYCHDSTILKCYRSLTNGLIRKGLIAEESRQITGNNVFIQYAGSPCLSVIFF